MKILIFSTLILLAACQAKQTPEQKAQAAIEEAAKPLIAKDVAELLYLVSTYENTDLPIRVRGAAFDKICPQFPEYMCPAYDFRDDTARYNVAVKMQIDYIEKKYRAMAAEELEKMAIEKRYSGQ